MSAQEADADQNVQQSDGQADAGVKLGGDTPSEGVTLSADAVTEQTTEAEPEGKADAPEAPPEPEVPESYDLAAPEGVVVPETVVTKFSESAKEHKLTQEQAAGVFRAAVDAHTADLQQRVERQRQEWASEVNADPTLGGENLKVTIDKANRVLRAYDKDGSFTALLNQTGLGGTKAGLAFLTAIQKATAVDEIVVGNVGEQPGPVSAKSHFPNSPALGE